MAWKGGGRELFQEHHREKVILVILGINTAENPVLPGFQGLLE
jgi:hypothetical protein